MIQQNVIEDKEFASDAPEVNRSHIPVLDGLRALAVGMVLYAHLTPSLPDFWLLNLLDAVIRPGYLGVGLFFVLSGFLITRILLYNRVNKVSLSSFFIRRSARIFPIYYLTIIICAAAMPGNYALEAALYISNFTFSFNLTANPLRHTWSLCVEEHFYLVWPFIIAFIPWKKLTSTIWGFIIGAIFLTIAIALLLPSDQSRNLIYRASFTNMLLLAFGAWLAVIEPKLKTKSVSRNYQIGLSVAAIFLIGATPFVADSIWLGPVRHIGYAVFAAALFTSGLVHSSVKWLNGCLSNSFISQMGKISYGLYLYHYPIFYALGVLKGESSPLLTLAAMFLTVFLATLSYYYLELPILKFVTQPSRRFS